MCTKGKKVKKKEKGWITPFFGRHLIDKAPVNAFKNLLFGRH